MSELKDQAIARARASARNMKTPAAPVERPQPQEASGFYPLATTTRLRPPCLASYSAWSARRMMRW